MPQSEHKPTRTEIYSNAFYAKLAEEAEEVVVDGNKSLVWKGFIGQTCRSIGIPLGTDRRITKSLEEMDCIQFASRGVMRHPSVIVLLRPPTDDLWAERTRQGALTSPPSLAILAREVEDIRKSLGGANIAKILVNLDKRLTTVESFIKKTGK